MYKTMHHYNSRGIVFTKRELNDLLKSFLVIGLAFSIANYGFKLDFSFLVVLFISMLTAGTAFLFHELAHKVMAQKYGCWSEFMADNSMLVVTMIVSFLGFLFAAPGAVYINGSLTKKEYGKISAAGPLTNIVLALIFMAVMLLSPSELGRMIGMIGMTINAWIGLFNMIPLWQFDGLKIWRWSKVAYILIVLAAVGLSLAAGAF